MINGNGMAFRNQKCDLHGIAETIDLFIYQFGLFLVMLTCNSEKESQNVRYNLAIVRKKKKSQNCPIN